MQPAPTTPPDHTGAGAGAGDPAVAGIAPHDSLGPGAATLQGDLFWLGLGYFVLAFGSDHFSIEPGNVAAVWFANSAAVAFILQRPPARWRWLLAVVCIANLVADGTNGDGWLRSLGFVPGNATDVLTACWLLKRTGAHIGFDASPRAFGRMLLFGVVVPPLVGATVGSILVHGHGLGALGSVWIDWYAGSFVGASCVLPLGLYLARRLAHRLPDWRAFGRFAGLAGLVVAVDWVCISTLPHGLVYMGLSLIAAALWAPPMTTFGLCLAVGATVVVAFATGALPPAGLAEPWRHLAIFVPIVAIVLPAQILAITLHRLQKALKLATLSRHRYAVLYDTAPVMLHTVDNDGRLLMVNQQWLRVLGYGQAGQVVGQPAESFFRDATPAMADAAGPAGGTPPGRPQLRQMHTRDGQVIDVLFTRQDARGAAPLPWEGVCAIEDVTERIRLRLALESERNQLAALSSATQDLMAIIDAQGRLLSVNRAWARLTGRPAEDLVGLPIGPTTAAAPLAARTRLALARVMAGEVLMEQWPIELPGIGVRTMALTLQPARDAQERVVGAIVSAHDVNDLVESERALRQTVNELRHANTSLQQFARVCAHDLREPLNAIIGFTQLVEQGTRGQALAPSTARFLGLVSKSAHRMKAMLDDLLQFVRLDRIDIDDSRPVALDQVLADVQLALTEPLKASGARLHVPALPAVRGVHSLLVLLFQNLLSNAIKFVPEGRAPVIELYCQTWGGTVRVTVQDNGIGVPPAMVDRLFKPFARLHTQRQFEGTGLGLAIAQRIAEAHGGRIACEPAGAQGSRFHVDLPLFGAAARAAAVGPATPALAPASDR
jgi:PAS domain S-box-containing protein